MHTYIINIIQLYVDKQTHTKYYFITYLYKYSDNDDYKRNGVLVWNLLIAV